MEKVKQAGMKNYGDYVREMAMKGYVIEVDYSAVKEFAYTLSGSVGRKGNNLAHHLIQSFDPGEVSYKEAWFMYSKDHLTSIYIITEFAKRNKAA